MAWLGWLLASRSSTLVVRQGVPIDALDTVARTLTTMGYRMASDVAAPQTADYRLAATADRTVRFEPVVRPKRAEDVHSVVVRQRDDHALRVTVGFGPTRIPQIVGGLLALGVGAIVVARGGGAIETLIGLLYYPLGIALVLLFMPGKINRDAVRSVVSVVERAIDAERSRAADSVRRRVEATPEPIRVAGEALAADPADDSAGEGAAGPAARARARIP